MTRPAFDLRAALRQRSSQQLADLLWRVPALAEALQGRGPLAGVGPYGLVYPVRSAQVLPTAERLTVLLASPAGIDTTLAALDGVGLRLATLAVWHGGVVSRQAALAEAGADRADDLDAAATAMADLLLTDPDGGWVALRTGVAQVLRLPGIPVRDGLASMGSDAIARMLRGLGVDRPPTRKAERLDALQTRLRDGDAVRATASRLSGEALRVLNLLLDQGPQRVPDVGIPYYTHWGRGDTVLHELAGHGLVGVDAEQQVCWVWLDVVVGLNGRLFSHWPALPPAPKPRPLRETAGLPAVLGRFAALLAHWAREPAPALQDGGLGVRPVRAAAKALGMAAGEVGLLAGLAVSLGLLGRVSDGFKGRGRTRVEQRTWAPTPLADEFAALPPERRWALLVQTWRDDTRVDETTGLPERVADGASLGAGLTRCALLRLLAAQRPGAGLDIEDLTALADFGASGGLRGPAVGHVVTAARVLGLVPSEGPVGLTTLGRALLDGPAALAATLPPPRTEFTVQADLSVIAPPDLAPDIAGRLERYAELESMAGARLYRLSERRLAAALDAGEDAEAILSFLSEHATAALAQNVTYLLRDCERRHGRLRTGSCMSYVRSDDAALLTPAVAVKAAKLRALGPTVAVSSLPLAKVVAALRARGLMPVAEDADGAVLRPDAPAALPDPRAARVLPPLREALEVRAADTVRLAEAVLATAAPPPPLPGLRRGLPPGSGRASSRFVADQRWLDATVTDGNDENDWDDWDDDADDEEIGVEALASQREVLRRLVDGGSALRPVRRQA